MTGGLLLDHETGEAFSPDELTTSELSLLRLVYALLIGGAEPLDWRWAPASASADLATASPDQLMGFASALFAGVLARRRAGVVVEKGAPLAWPLQASEAAP